MKWSILLLVGCAAAIDVPRQPYAPTGSGKKRLTFNETVVKRAISPSAISVEWISTSEDGDYVYQDQDGSLKIQSIVTNHTQTLVPADKVPEDAYSYWIHPNLSSVLWATNYTKQYRHSYFADYFIQDVQSMKLRPLAPDQSGDIQYAQWTPTGDAIAFVRDNNVFVWTNASTSQITNDGGPDLFNGVPDWIYEEEILGDRFALWFSPDGAYLAFLRFNETGVPTFTVPYYMDNEEIAPPYPRELELRYPKVSQTNPTVELNLLELRTGERTPVPIDAFDAKELIIGEVAWLTGKHDVVAVKAFNRVQDRQKVVAVDVASLRSKTISERDGTDGWLDNLLSMAYIGPIGESKEEYYIDISDQSGWAHLWLFPVAGGEPIALTKGEWEVTNILSIDKPRQLVYFLSTKHHSTERHLYSVSWKTKEITPLVDDTVPAVWSASFSSQGGYYILSYRGPDVPYQDLYAINSTAPLRTITSNAAVLNALKEYTLPNITYFELALPSGETLNVMQRLPVKFSPKKKYPVLFTPYGGPGAQEVSKAWQALDFKAYIASDPELEYITWTVDNRGTGYKGRAFRCQVASRLGELEAADQVFAAQQAAKLPYVDAQHIAIWGWSYGGYLTGKVIETDSGAFSLGVQTAPVSDWRFYDSMYTERYMKTLESNAAGYNASAIRKVAGYKNVRGGVLIQHGTGDDNVHFQNAAALVDTLVGAGVTPEKLQVQWFTDSDHGIRYHGGNVFLYRQLSKRLYEEKKRKEKGEAHQWSKKSVL
ncbi:prolyl dipeptidyl peptidase DppIV [Aspergillus fumigatus Af293]|uniref:Probable dipeptidyl peptidase 4 n=1 Tax=Aspergillus fumigatus (strain ATCC MYA-4609 / CBS 101355 / FGSC A1100 / Af293) TaxID=330879 RepID=DPP4_ASPFU|nr:extracellular dipeptidyl-peptidase Dpp4 [Aspergillus fumigatus Af293]Q4WPH9.1 RecName: Full=Probable dipeptidyl peptidase 4; AltName: Full=Dipeptidyl peptidase IV; Short=DPP IV; Short=DppIV; Flags: Precursor [Aspergillus fumigatus Af293]EAL89855.1 extracellular dipeptidyl-peptidase Dpp4 [Aspergillus fumigatus Af293]KAH2752154.1 diacylglycerol pyrophosphate phosphatase [Aspergillus fumigatus]